MVRPAHLLTGVAKSRSLFVATPPPILPRGKHGAGSRRRMTEYTSLLVVAAVDPLRYPHDLLWFFCSICFCNVTLNHEIMADLYLTEPCITL